MSQHLGSFVISRKLPLLVGRWPANLQVKLAILITGISYTVIDDLVYIFFANFNSERTDN